MGLIPVEVEEIIGNPPPGKGEEITRFGVEGGTGNHPLNFARAGTDSIGDIQIRDYVHKRGAINMVTLAGGSIKIHEPH